MTNSDSSESNAVVPVAEAQLGVEVTLSLADNLNLFSTLGYETQWWGGVGAPAAGADPTEDNSASRSFDTDMGFYGLAWSLGLSCEF